MNKWDIAIKATRVIKSCKTMEQLAVARNYCKQVAKLFWLPWQKKGVNRRFAQLLASKHIELKGGNI